MVSTQQARLNPADDSFPTTQLFLLGKGFPFPGRERVDNQWFHLNPLEIKCRGLFSIAICRVAEPIAMTSIFPYSWVMVRDFDVGEKSDASLYAGILVSAFSLAEALTGMFWGGVSDCVGRKPVLLLGCVGTILSLLIVGFATNYWVALAGRIIGGALNGNVGVVQTMVGELVKRPEHERKFPVLF
jgi:MFS family permease